MSVAEVVVGVAHENGIKKVAIRTNYEGILCGVKYARFVAAQILEAADFIDPPQVDEPQSEQEESVDQNSDTPTPPGPIPKHRFKL